MSRLYGTAGGFPLRDDYWTSQVLHLGGRGLAWIVLAWLVVGLWRGTGIARSVSRPAVGWMIATALLAALLIATLKRLSSTSCPWDLVEFGGIASHVSHWRFGVADGGAGRCFPSGHASSAFAFLTGYFALRPSHPARAHAWLAGVALAGALFGWAQLARGAHFASHTLWTAWWCWAICCASFHIADAAWPRMFHKAGTRPGGALARGEAGDGPSRQASARMPPG